MDLLDQLLAQPTEDAYQRLRDALGRNSPPVEEIVFNVYEVTLDRDAQQVRVYDVLDARAEPTAVSVDELRSRLA